MRLRAHQVVNEQINQVAGFATCQSDLRPISLSPIHRKSFWDITLRLSEVYLMVFVSIVNWPRENSFFSFRGLQPKFFSTFDPKNFGLLPTSTIVPTATDCGEEGSRTPDPLLAKQMLYQLSYFPNFLSRPECGYLDSNQGPQLYQSCALAN